MDVAGGDDHVDVGLDGLAHLGDELVAPLAHGVDARHGLPRQLRGAFFHGGTPFGRHVGDLKSAGRDALGDLLAALVGAHHEVDEGPHDAAGQKLTRVLDHHVDQRHVDLVDADHTQQAQAGALGGVGRVRLDVPLDVVGDRLGCRAGAGDEGLIQLERLLHCHTFLGESSVSSAAAAAGTAARPLTTSKTGTRSLTASAIARNKSVGLYGCGTRKGLVVTASTRSGVSTSSTMPRR